jgi:hypothetical protein
MLGEAIWHLCLESRRFVEGEGRFMPLALVMENRLNIACLLVV